MEAHRKTNCKIAVVKGDGIGVDVTDAPLRVIKAALAKVGGVSLEYDEISAGAGYFAAHGVEIEEDGEVRAGAADVIFLGAIRLPAVRHADGTEISHHLRLWDRFGLYAGVRPVKAYPNAPQRLADPRAAEIDMVILRESTEVLFYLAAVHDRKVLGGAAMFDTMKVSRGTIEKLHRFAFNLAQNAFKGANQGA